MRCAKNRIYLNSPEFHQLFGNFSNHDNCLIAVLSRDRRAPRFSRLVSASLQFESGILAMDLIDIRNPLNVGLSHDHVSSYRMVNITFSRR